MKCYVHNEVEAELFCQQCGKACCNECIHKIGELYYCDTCKDTVRQEIQVKTKSPGLALFLSFLIPGAGQLYNNQYLKGASIIAFLVGIIYTIASDAVVAELHQGIAIMSSVAIFVIWLFSMIDAYNEASYLRKGIQRIDVRLTIYWAVIAIITGILLLLFNFNVIPDNHFYKLWPFVLIAIGGRFLIKTSGNHKREESNE
ncbi:MAG: hypothetical protein A2Y62_22275 [Candidatus Fischerbacteria bacterium RBG_13_37_8]|uniref:B box-type domain-containing protein n=1 Tax=Candidatus Fischerbacteria bacterium RBG_13_37_8 TaxID=1817863 RepID=A0A1F5VKV1_9BACT|nr:MAG: hypothetical protein A2Y62_22275 [Candidatus Fischerbacteria bacterium RBG_13_37_8]